MPHRSRLLASLVWPLAVLAAAVSATPFYEKINVPRAASVQDFRTLLKAHFATYERMQDKGPEAFIRDRNAYKQWSDLFFCLTRAMDEKLPLADLADFGLLANPDGSYTVDLKQYPQWELLDSRLQILTNPDVFESYVPVLKARGFRDADVHTLRTYLATHDPEQAALSEGKQLVETFGERIQKHVATGVPISPNEVMAYRYQKTRIKQEAARKWAVDLLDTLDKQRRRILASFFEEELESKLTFGVPVESFDQTLEREVQPFISGEYVKQLSHTEAEIRRNVEARAEKLMRGSNNEIK